MGKPQARQHGLDTKWQGRQADVDDRMLQLHLRLWLLHRDLCRFLVVPLPRVVLFRLSEVLQTNLELQTTSDQEAMADLEFSISK